MTSISKRLPVFAVTLGCLLFAGALFWAKSRDPFQRIWFTVKTQDHGKAKCIAVLPKMAARPLPVVIYLHGSGGSLLGSGNELLQMAEMGSAAIGMEYNQTNKVAFEAQFSGLLNFMQRQRWADTNAVAWVGFSLGANQSLAFALKHPQARPKLLVQISGGWVPELEGTEAGSRKPESSHSTLNPKPSTVLLIHGEQDEAFPIADARRVAAALATNGFQVELKIISGQSHAFEPNRLVLFRAVGEYCLAHLRSANAFKNYESILSWQGRARPLWWFWLPALLWVVAWWYAAWKRLRLERGLERPKFNGWKVGLRWLAGIFVLLAMGQTAVHLVTPRCPVTSRTLELARRHLVQPKEISDFDYLSTNGFRQGKRLKALLEHVELANYNRELVNWKLDDDTYRRYVLSSQVDETRDGDMPWRRALWESFYPWIRKEQSLEAAAEIIVRHLRERITIVRGQAPVTSIAEIWTKQVTDESGFEAIYVAALRSAGVPSHLSANGQAELYTGIEWKPAASPVIKSLVR